MRPSIGHLPARAARRSAASVADRFSYKPGYVYARRWRVENGIAEAVKFFHLNSMSSPILTKVHFDVALTMVADTLYTMLARKLRGFEDCDAPKLYRHFVRGKGAVNVKGSQVTVSFPRRAHNPILRGVPWKNPPSALTLPSGARLTLRFG